MGQGCIIRGDSARIMSREPGWAGEGQRGRRLQCRLLLATARPRRDKFWRGPEQYRNWATEYLHGMTNSKRHHQKGFYHLASYAYFAT